MVVFACSCRREGRARHAGGCPKVVEATNGKHPGLHEQVPEGPALHTAMTPNLNRSNRSSSYRRDVRYLNHTSTLGHGQHYLPTPFEVDW